VEERENESKTEVQRNKETKRVNIERGKRINGKVRCKLWY
jgi:hypothetical protein